MSGSARIAHARAAAAGEPTSVGAERMISWSEPDGGLWLGAGRDAAFYFATLGLHQFWARVAQRRRVWSSIRLDGRPLAYTGSVGDLLRPALVALGLLAAMAAGVAVMAYFAIPRPRVAPSPWRLAVSIPLVFMVGIRLWRAKAYLLASSRWCGLTGRLIGSPLPFAATHLAGALMLPLTLGWVLPWRQRAMLRRLVGAIEIGGRRVELATAPPILWRRFWLPWLGAIAVYLGALLALALTMGPKITAAVAERVVPDFTARDWAIIAGLALSSVLTLAALSAWHRIGGLRAALSNARLGGVPLRLHVSDGAFVAFAVGNTLIKLASFGALAPLAEARLIRFFAQSLAAGQRPAHSSPA